MSCAEKCLTKPIRPQDLEVETEMVEMDQQIIVDILDSDELVCDLCKNVQDAIEVASFDHGLVRGSRIVAARGDTDAAQTQAASHQQV